MPAVGFVGYPRAAGDTEAMITDELLSTSRYSSGSRNNTHAPQGNTILDGGSRIVAAARRRSPLLPYQLQKIQTNNAATYPLILSTPLRLANNSPHCIFTRSYLFVMAEIRVWCCVLCCGCELCDRGPLFFPGVLQYV